jgi:hypothetical protein
MHVMFDGLFMARFSVLGFPAALTYKDISQPPHPPNTSHKSQPYKHGSKSFLNFKCKTYFY